METVIMHPENKKQLKALKAVAKALNVNFETTDSPYDPLFVAEILKGEKARQEGKKGLRVNVDDPMEIDLYEKAEKDFEFWKKSGNKAIQNKIRQLFLDMKLHPFEGLGKPEPLKYNLSGKWSRRINNEHRIIYDVTGDTINVYSLKGHY